MSQTATLILTHGQIHTLDRANPLAEAVAIADGKIVATGSHDRIMSFAAEGTQIVDLKGHTVIPGLNDSHLHLIRGGLNYNLELRWEGVPSLADALRMLKDSGGSHAVPAVGAGGRRLERISVRRAADADPGRAERGGA